MKKRNKFLFIGACVLCFGALIVSNISKNDPIMTLADITSTYTINSKDWGTSGGQWTSITDLDYQNSKYCVTSGTASGYSPISYDNITSISVANSLSGSGAGTIKVYKSSDLNTWTLIGSGKTAGSTATWSGLTNTSGYVKVEIARTKGYVYVSSITIKYEKETSSHTEEETDDSESGTYSFVLDKNTFNKGSYLNGTKTVEATKSGSKEKMSVDLTVADVMTNSGGTTLQMKKSSGLIYNTTDLGVIKSVTINDGNGLTTYYGTTKHPLEKTTIDGNYGFFTIKNGTSNAVYPISITVVYEILPEKELTSRTIKTNPAKLTYEAGEYFDPTGLVLSENYSDETHEDLLYSSTNEKFSFEPLLTTKLTSTDKAVKVKYDNELVGTIDIDVLTLKSVAVSNNTKSSFKDGDNFAFDGKLVGTYGHSNGGADTTKDITTGLTFAIGGQAVTTSTTLNRGEYTVTVGFNSVTTTYDISVGYADPTSVSIINGNLEAGPGSEFELVANVLPSTACQDVTFEAVTTGTNLVENTDFTLIGNKLTILEGAKEETLVIKATATGFSVSSTIEVTISSKVVPVLSGVSVSGTLVNKTQVLGKQFNPTGLTFEPIYTPEDPEEKVQLNADSFTWPTLDTLGDSIAIRGAYKENSSILTEEIIVNVIEDYVSSIEFDSTAMKVSYFETETEWNFSGLTIKGTMFSGDSAVINQANVSYSANKTISDLEVGVNQEIVVTASYAGKTAELTMSNIEIKENSITEFYISKNPTKLAYTLGEDLDLTGLEVKGVYADGVTEEVVEPAINLTAFNKFEEGTYQISVSYGDATVKSGKSSTFNVTVSKVVFETTKSWKKVTEVPSDWSGEYLITSENYIFDGSLTKIDVDLNYIQDSSYTGVDDNEIEYNSTNAESSFTIEKLDNSSNYSLKSKSGYYIGNNTTDNKIQSSTDSAYSVTISSTNSTFDGKVKIKGSSKALKFNHITSGTTQARFRFMTDNSNFVYLYKFSETSSGVASEIGLTSASLISSTLFKVGDTLNASQIKATLLYNDATTKEITSNLTIRNGLAGTYGSSVTLNEGDNTIYVKYGNFETSFVVNARALVKVTEIEVLANDEVLFEGQTTYCEAFISPDGADNQSVTWSSSNPDIATVDAQTGVVTANSVANDGNKVTITATANDGSGITGSVELTINSNDLVDFIIDEDSFKTEYNYGDSLDLDGLTILAEYEYGDPTEVEFNGSNMDIDVTLDEDDKVTHATSILTVTYLGQTDSITLKVNKIVTSMSATADIKETIYSDDESHEIEVNIHKLYSDNTTSDSIEKVTLTGDMLSSGSHTENILIDGEELSYSYTVVESVVESIEVKTAPSTIVYFVGDDFDKTGLVVTATYTSGKTKDITADKLTIENGTNLQSGTDSITVSFGGKSLTQTITIENESDVQSISLVGTYNQTVVLGEDYVFDGQIKALYQSGSRDITSKVKASIEENIDTSTVGEKTYTVNYYGKTLLITVDVVYAEATKVTISNPMSGNHYVGTEVDLIANVTPTNAEQKVNWSSSSTSVATIDENGHLVVVGAGEVTITAYVGELTDSFTFTGITPVSSISLDKDNIVLGTLEGFNTAKLNVTVNPSEAFDKSFTFSVTDKDGKQVEGLVIDENGNIIATSVGEYVITVTSNNGKTDTCNVKVLGVNDLTEIKVVGEYTNSVVMGEPYSFDGRIVAIYEFGEVDITEEVLSQISVDTTSTGEKNVTITYSGKTVNLTVNVVYANPTSVSITTEVESIYKVGDEVTLNALVGPEEAEQKVTWTTSNASIATVDDNGKVIFIGSGTVLITATAGNVSDSVTFVVSKSVTGVTLDHHELTLTEGDESKLTPTVEPTDATNTNVRFVSSDQTGLLVSNNGSIIALKPGTYVVTVFTKDGEFSDSCIVTVNPAEITPVNPDIPDNPNTPDNPDSPEENGKINTSLIFGYDYFVKGIDAVKGFFGCSGSIVAASLIASISTFTAAGLIVLKKKKEDK